MRTFRAAIAIMIAFALASCQETAVARPGSIAGFVRDGVTGEGIPDAFIQIGDRFERTGYDGAFLVSYRDDAPVTGKFLASKGIRYAFWGVQDLTFAPGDNPSYTVYLDPSILSSYPRKTITIDYSGFADKGSSPQLDAFVTNSNGGRWLVQDVDSGDSFTTPTFGPDCVVVLQYSDDAHETFTQYYRVDLSGDIAIPFKKEITQDEDVTVNGTNGDVVMAELDLGPHHNMMSYFKDAIAIATGTSVAVSVNNPSDYPFIWKNVVATSGAPEPGFQTIMLSISDSTPQSPSVTLPARPTAAPTSKLDLSSVAWDQDAKALSFAMPGNATFCVLEFLDDTGYRGYYFATGGSIDFSGPFYDTTLYAGWNWDIAFRPVYTTGTMSQVLSMRITGFGPCEISGCDISYVVGDGTNDKSVDAIP